MDNRKIIDLTIFLSDDVCQALISAGTKAQKNKNNTIDVEHFLWSILSYDIRIKEILTNTAQYTYIVEETNNKLAQKQKWDKKPDKVEMSSELRNALMRSIYESILLKEQFISPLSLLLSISKLKLTSIDYESIIKSLNLTQGLNLSPNEEKLPDTFHDITSITREELFKYIDRTNYTDQIIRLLYKDVKKNILLIGNDGIGKASTRFALAQKAKEENTIFSDSKVFAIDAPKISYINATQVLSPLKEEAGNAITGSMKYVLYINNIEITANEASRDFANITPLFEDVLSSQIWGIIPIDYSQYQILIKSYPNIIKNSETIFMDEPDTDTAINMIQTRYSNASDVTISNDTIKDTVTLARRFIHDKFLPENAISLIDEAFSQARIDKRSEISTNDIKSILSQKTGVPLTDLTEQEASDLQNLDALLKESVIGQDMAVDAVAKTIKRSRAGLKDPRRPIGSFLFVGPSGTGKTQLAKALAKAIYKDENAMIRIDMSEYTDSHTVDRLIGAPPGYVGYEEGGQLTNKVLKKPYSLVLLDEVEKANPKVFDIFLQVLDDGRLTDGQGKTVDFKNTIIIMTSNLADENNLNQFFRPEFLNRIDQIIHFNPLTTEVGKSIVRLFVKDLETRLAEKNITIEVSDSVIEQIASQGITDKYGARPLKRLVEEKIEDPIVEKIIAGEIKPGETLTWNQI